MSIHGLRFQRLIGDVSGAFADLGTFLPLVVGVLAVGGFDPTGVLVGFGVFALAVAGIYRRPVPVQPMKAVAAVVIATGLGPGAVAACGLALGLVLAVLAVSGAIGGLARLVPRSLLLGIQLGVGAHLAIAGFGYVIDDPAVGGLALAGLVAVLLTPLRAVACLLLLAVSAGWSVVSGGHGLAGLTPGIHLPAFAWPAAADFITALGTVFLPQLALTITNAVLATAAISEVLFPADRTRITPRRLALGSGVLNLVLAPFGAIPMCHGAGGLVVQHRFGARGGVAPALFGLACLALGVFLGPGAMILLTAVPLAAVGALLVVAGCDLAFSRRLFEVGPLCLAFVAVTGLVCVVVNVAVGFAAGLALELLRAAHSRFMARRRG